MTKKRKKRVAIIGIDGYLGWATAHDLKSRGYEVYGIDNLLRREATHEVGAGSVIPLPSPEERQEHIDWEVADVLNYSDIKRILGQFKPDVIIHYGEMPAAPYSMIDAEHAAFTQKNNVIGSLNLLWAIKEECPDAHLIKLATMGEYGCPNIDIPEGYFEIEYRGRKDKLLFPKEAGSWYHETKVHDSNNLYFACKIWDLRATDINQGVVYGTRTDNMDEDWQRTRYDIDGVFGTVINRFVAQAVIGYPLTVYGKGGQTRGYLNINDTLAAIRLNIEQPADKGQFRIINQFHEVFSVNELAEMVKEEAEKVGLDVDIKSIPNPRKEPEKHYYNPDNDTLFEMGWEPRTLREAIIPAIKDLQKYKKEIEAQREEIKPKINW